MGEKKLSQEQLFDQFTRLEETMIAQLQSRIQYIKGIIQNPIDDLELTEDDLNNWKEMCKELDTNPIPPKLKEHFITLCKETYKILKEKKNGNSN